MAVDLHRILSQLSSLVADSRDPLEGVDRVSFSIADGDRGGSFFDANAGSISNANQQHTKGVFTWPS